MLRADRIFLPILALHQPGAAPWIPTRKILLSLALRKGATLSDHYLFPMEAIALFSRVIGALVADPL
jgi:hypothetical protein